MDSTTFTVKMKFEKDNYYNSKFCSMWIVGATADWWVYNFSLWMVRYTVYHRVRVNGFELKLSVVRKMWQQQLTTWFVVEICLFIC